MKQVVPVLGEAPPLDQARCLAIVDFLRRCHRADRAEAADPGQRTPTSAGLVQLFRQGRLTFQETDTGTVDLFYTPSRDSSQRLSDGGAETEDNFPEGIRKKQAAAFRVTPGAIFRMPAEQGENEIEIFITDWSPCPAACAVAVHRAHPFVGDLEKRPGSFFSGRYVRHPLTGDLLPVWVADWVKPSFGTGAVLVNPAHDKVDLEFGRKVGLPIRFALVPLSFDSTPATWPRPPVIKTGRSIKTGPYDGLLHTDAMQKYYEVLESQGLAFRHKDVQSGYWRIARLRPDPQGDLLWNPSRLQLAERESTDEGFLPMAVEEAGMVEAALAIAPDSRPALVCPSGEQAESLLAVRLLYYDLHRQPLQVSEVFLVQKVQESKAPVNADVLNLAMLFGSPLQQVLVLKQQVFEQIQRFIRIHGELVKSAGTVASEGDSSKQAQKVKAASLEGDPAKAFSALYQLQKQIEGLSAEQRPGALMAGYFAVAHVLAGLDFPPGVDPATIWSQL